MEGLNGAIFSEFAEQCDSERRISFCHLKCCSAAVDGVDGAAAGPPNEVAEIGR